MEDMKENARTGGLHVRNQPAIAPSVIAKRRSSINKLQVSDRKRDSIGEEVVAKLSQSFVNFRMTDNVTKLKTTELSEERARLKTFEDYLTEDKVHQKLSRGVNYLTQNKKCDYINAEEAFRINAYDERKNVVKLDHLRQERDNLKVRHRDMLKEMVDLEVKKIKFKRAMRETYSKPKLIARSSGHSDATYVYGYGFTYGIGYTDHLKPCTAPAFEFVAEDHIRNVIKRFGPNVGQEKFDDLYQEIFNVKKKPQMKPTQNTFNLSSIYRNNKNGLFQQTNTQLTPRSSLEVPRP